MEDEQFINACVNYASVQVAKVKAIESAMRLLLSEYSSITVLRTSERAEVMKRIDTLCQMLRGV